MPDRYGPLEIPLVATRGRDALLVTVGEYFKAIANAHAQAEWTSVAPGEGAVVKRVFTHDPERSDFNQNQLPALFLYRLGQPTFVDEAQDVRITRSRLRCIWVPPPTGKGEVTSKRFNFAWALMKVLDDYLELGRDPAWKVAGDPDPEAALYGSVLPRHAGYGRLRMESVSPQTVSIQYVPQDGEPLPPPNIYPSYAAELEVEEELKRRGRSVPLNYISVALQAPKDASHPEPLPLVSLRLEGD